VILTFQAEDSSCKRTGHTSNSQFEKQASNASDQRKRRGSLIMISALELERVCWTSMAQLTPKAVEFLKTLGPIADGRFWSRGFHR
jgi:hypothetical protein